MTRKTKDVLMRSDRVLVGALAVILAAASAAVGAAATNRPHAEQFTSVHATAPVVAMVAKPQPVVPAVVAAPAEAAPVKGTTDIAMTQLLAEHRCLSEVMYYEARGEGVEGQKAVAEVVFHRLRHGQYGHSICAVVYEGAGSPGCQFSFTCDGELALRKSPGAWHTAEALAARILTGETALTDATGNATHFHAVSVAPDWADDNGMERTVQIGNHIFYRHARSRAL